MKIAITGATGHLGKLIIATLKEKVSADDLLAIVRSAQKAQGLGVESREANYDDPETLDRALSGVDTLMLISSSEVGKRAAQHNNVIEAAKKTGVKHIVYTSILRADTTSISLAKEHLLTEESLKNSGIPFTILRNGWYTENYTGSIPGAIAGGAFIGSAGEGKISGAARKDYAEAAAVVLTTSGYEGKVYELAGDQAWTLADLAAETSRQTGKDLAYVNLPQAEYASALKGFGLPEALAHDIAGWDVAASKGDLFDDEYALSRLIGRPTTPLAAVVTEALAAPSAGDDH
jgi:NAD(P)H dehydrogenase (quinone)